MSYKLTSFYGIPHGHAVAVCLPKIWKYMLLNIDNCIDIRGKKYLIHIFNAIAIAMGEPSVESAIQCFEGILEDFEMPIPEYKEEDLEVLTASVNVTRLKNNPVYLSEEDLYMFVV